MRKRTLALLTQLFVRRQNEPMPLSMIVRSLEMWTDNMNTEDDTMRRHLLQSFPGELYMHRDWASELGQSYRAPRWSVRLRHWRQRHKRLNDKLRLLYRWASTPGAMGSFEDEWYGLHVSIRSGIYDAQTRMCFLKTREQQGPDGLRYLRRQSAFYFRDDLFAWEVQARILRRQFGNRLLISE